VEKYGRNKQATGDNVIRRMWFACWSTKRTKATDTHSEYVILISHCSNGYTKALHVTFVIRTLPVLFRCDFLLCYLFSMCFRLLFDICVFYVPVLSL
jgi:hypothetical protein